MAAFLCKRIKLNSLSSQEVINFWKLNDAAKCWLTWSLHNLDISLSLPAYVFINSNSSSLSSGNEFIDEPEPSLNFPRNFLFSTSSRGGFLSSTLPCPFLLPSPNYPNAFPSDSQISITFPPLLAPLQSMDSFNCHSPSSEMLQSSRAMGKALDIREFAEPAENRTTYRQLSSPTSRRGYGRKAHLPTLHNCTCPPTATAPNLTRCGFRWTGASAFVSIPNFIHRTMFRFVVCVVVVAENERVWVFAQHPDEHRSSGCAVVICVNHGPTGSSTIPFRFVRCHRFELSGGWIGPSGGAEKCSPNNATDQTVPRSMFRIRRTAAAAAAKPSVERMMQFQWSPSHWMAPGEGGRHRRVKKKVKKE